MEELYLPLYIILLGSLFIASTTGYKWDTWAEQGSVQFFEKPSETVDGFWDAKVRARRGSKSEKKRRQERQHKAGPVQNDFDYLGFAQHYGPTVCFQKKIKIPKWNCSPEDKWTIHGLWPVKNENHMQNCDDSKKILAQDFKPYEEGLGKKWTNLYLKQGNTKDPYCFWRYQWLKHGTCTGRSRKLNSFDKYFKEALGLFDRYHISKVFERVVRGDKPDQYLQAIRGAFQKDGRITCYNYKNEQYIQQIEICLNKDTLEIVDCPWPFKRLCDSKKEVLYPSWEKLEIELNRGSRRGSPKGWGV